MGREGVSDHGVRVVFTSCRTLKQPKIYGLALYYMFYIILGVSAVVVSLYETVVMCWLASLVGGGLRLSGPSSGRNGSVRVYRSVM